MRRESIFLLETLIMAVSMLCGSAQAFSGAGSGTEADPYVITTVQQLQEMQDELNAYYVLGNDIDASDTVNWNGGEGFQPVGPDTGVPNDSFTGKFDGRGHVISGLYINRPSTGSVGLFGFIYHAQITNVGLTDADITALGGAGTLVGSSEASTISNSWASGTVTGPHSIQSPIGGLIGWTGGVGGFISRCHSSVNVFAISSGWPANRTGGLTGVNSRGSIIEDCYATGNVSAKNKVGGLVGDNVFYSEYGGYIARCYSTGHVTGNGGGLIGYNYRGGITYDSYWDINTSGKSSSKGGTGKTTTQMIQQATFVNWDFVEVWDIVENKTYPFLRPFLKPILVGVDIKPGSCPNPLNVKSRGVLPVAILGSEDFDVNTIDIASIRLAGIAPIRSSFEDVAAPLSDANECECSKEGPDGFLDLTLKFETQKILEAIGEVDHGDELVLALTGVLSDETPVNGSDCIVIRGRHKPLNRADFNGDGTVDMADFAAFAENWLQSSISDE